MDRLTKDVLYNVLQSIIDVGLIEKAIEELDAELSNETERNIEIELTKYFERIMKEL